MQGNPVNPVLPSTSDVLTWTGSSWAPLGISSDGDWTIAGSDMYSAVAGNVGIGTNGPAQKLDVRDGNIILGHLWNDGTTTTDVRIGKPDGAGGFGAGSASILFKDGPAPAANVNAGTAIAFFTHDFGLGTNEAMRIMPEGKVGIGTADPFAPFHVTKVEPNCAQTSSNQNGVQVFGGDCGNNASIQLTTSGGVPYIDFANGFNEDFDSRIILNTAGGLDISSLADRINLVAPLGTFANRVTDSDNTLFFSDPASTSQFNDMRANIYYDLANTFFFVDPAGQSTLNALLTNQINPIGAPLRINPASALFTEINRNHSPTSNQGVYIGPIVSGTFSDLTVGSGGLSTFGPKSFITDHPLDPDNKNLIHASVEGPENAVYYRGEAQLVNGVATVQLPDYFEGLVGPNDRTIQVTPILDGTGQISQLAVSPVVNGQFTVEATDSNNPNQGFYWEVKAVRADIPPLVTEMNKIPMPVE